MLAVAVGGTVVLNLVTTGAPRSLERLASLTPSPSPSAAGGVSVVVRPTSGPAEAGVDHPVSLVGDCGIWPVIDFDGSFWRLPGGGMLSGLAGRLRDPVDPASITMVTAHRASVRTGAGQEFVVVRIRARELTVPGC
jgi:hypothetical protein